MTYSPHRTRLVLQLGFDGSPVPAADIRAWLAAGDIACAILTVSGPLDRDGRDALKTCVTDFQDGDVAVLIADDPELAQEVKSDGVHLSARPDIVEVYSALREARSSDWIIGTEPGDERHTAMTLGEAGADYLAFHLPAQKDQALWWAEVFEVPAIAAGPDVAAAAELAGARIEFVAVPGEVSAIEAMETILTAAPMVSA